MPPLQLFSNRSSSCLPSQFEADYDYLTERLTSRIKQNVDNVLLCLQDTASTIELPHSRTIVPHFEETAKLKLRLCGLRTLSITPIVPVSERQACVVKHRIKWQSRGKESPPQAASPPLNWCRHAVGLTPTTPPPLSYAAAVRRLGQEQRRGDCLVLGRVERDAPQYRGAHARAPPCRGYFGLDDCSPNAPLRD